MLIQCADWRNCNAWDCPHLFPHKREDCPPETCRFHDCKPVEEKKEDKKQKVKKKVLEQEDKEL